MRNFTADNSAWADFLISKAALILASIVLFAALFHLVANFKDFERQKQLDYVARDFKNAVDKVGATNFQEDVSKGSPVESSDNSPGVFKEISYCFSEKEVFRALPFGRDPVIRVSGEYVSLEAESDGRSFSAVRPFAFRILSFNESVLQEKFHTRFGTDGSVTSPLTADCAEVETFVRALETEEVVINPEKNVSLKKELIYTKDKEGVSAFACVLIYQ